MDIFIGVNIKFLRKQKKMSQLELADYLGLTMGTVSNLEHGRHTPSVQVLVSLVELFDCNLHELLFQDMSVNGVSKVEKPLSSVSLVPSDRVSIRLEGLLTDLEDRIRRECPECAKKLGL